MKGFMRGRGREERTESARLVRHARVGQHLHHAGT